MIHRATLLMTEADAFDEAEAVGLPVPIWELDLGDCYASR